MNYEKETANHRNGLQLSKDAEPAQLQNYFAKIFELRQSGEQFPINLDDVWPLVYSRKQKAFDVLIKDFIEGEDFNLTQMGKVVKTNELQNGVKVDAFLSVAAMEYFIAKKVKTVFEVYRKVFHKAAESNVKNLSEKATYNENQLFIAKIGRNTTHSYFSNSVLYTKLSSIMKFWGYSNGSLSRQYIERLGENNIIKVPVGSQDVWFANIEAIDGLLKLTTLDIPYEKVSTVYRDIFGIEKPKDENDPFTYHFTDSQMLAVIKEVNRKPVSKNSIIDLLLKGGRD